MAEPDMDEVVFREMEIKHKISDVVDGQFRIRSVDEVRLQASRAVDAGPLEGIRSIIDQAQKDRLHGKLRNIPQ